MRTDLDIINWFFASHILILSNAENLEMQKQFLYF